MIFTLEMQFIIHIQDTNQFYHLLDLKYLVIIMKCFVDDDGNGNVRRYYLSSGIRTYSNETQGTIDYSTGQITLNSLDIASISNIRGSISDKVEITVSPSSNDVVPVRDQILEIDIENSIVNVSEDTFVGGSSEAGVGYSTTSSY